VIARVEIQNIREEAELARNDPEKSYDLGKLMRLALLKEQFLSSLVCLPNFQQESSRWKMPPKFEAAPLWVYEGIADQVTRDLRGAQRDIYSWNENLPWWEKTYAEAMERMQAREGKQAFSVSDEATKPKIPRYNSPLKQAAADVFWKDREDVPTLQIVRYLDQLDGHKGKIGPAERRYLKEGKRSIDTAVSAVRREFRKLGLLPSKRT
jgi:hypothetical protein